jgi:hypothetical protein
MECSGISLDLVAQSLKYQQLFYMLSLSPTWRRLISAPSFFSLFSWHLYNVKQAWGLTIVSAPLGGETFATGKWKGVGLIGTHGLGEF